MSCKVISFLNMKGGVGKTTLCVNLAHCLANYKNKKVLIIDLDPQSNTTQYMLGKEKYKELIDENKTVFEIYKPMFESLDYSVIGNSESLKERTSNQQNIIHSIEENLSLIPGHLSMVRIAQGASPTAVLNLNNFIRINNLLEKYDFIFIDCPPTQSIYTDSALNCSDYYILPVKPDFLSSIGIVLVKNIIRSYNHLTSKKVKCAGIIFNIVQNQEHEKQMIEKIKNENINDVYDECIKYSSAIAKGVEKQNFLLNIPRQKNRIKKIADTFLKKVEGEN